MPHAAHPHVDERNLWLPPVHLRRYRAVKVGSALLLAAIFIFWLAAGWRSPWVRCLSFGLLVLTAWITIRSIRSDAERARSRQLEIRGDLLCGTRPAGAFQFNFAEIALAQWRESTAEELGLWLLSRDGGVLLHLDSGFFGDQAEARAFLRWARNRTRLLFEVRWPQGEHG